MNELTNKFIRQTTDELEKIRQKLNLIEDENLPENFSNEVFRRLHTVKGTAQTFNLTNAARLAHALENFLAAAKIQPAETGYSKDFLSAGISHLINALRQKSFQIPPDFAEKLSKFQTFQINAADFSDNVLPAEYFDKFSAAEQENINLAQMRGKDLFVLEIDFPLPTFPVRFREFSQKLAEKGEIVGSIPKTTENQKIGFQIVFAASSINVNEIEKTGAKIVFNSENIAGSSPNFASDLPGVLASVAAHGENLARKLEKDCEFIISAEPLELSPEKLKLIFDIILHLVRNAVDHGINQKGKIEISAKKSGKNLILKVRDDGSGIELEKIKSLAASRNLIQANENLPEQKIIDLIFVSGLTTAEKITEISGRGAGLDAVKNSVEIAGGTISVENIKGKGAAFEIFLPE